jgi:hypothetical protein
MSSENHRNEQEMESKKRAAGINIKKYIEMHIYIIILKQK